MRVTLAPMKTKVVPLEAGFDGALLLLQQGKPVAVPTETVYGLAADATDGAAISRIYEAKGRPSFNPLIVHVHSLEMAQSIAVFDTQALALAEKFWPGALTLVLPLKPNHNIHPLALAGLETVAVRMPVGALRELVNKLGRPLAAPSANRSGQLSPTSAAAVAESLDGKIGLVLDGGPTPIGVESTIVGKTDGQLTLLRAGGIAALQIEAVVGFPLNRVQNSGVVAPGMLASHYAPNAKIRPNAVTVEKGEALLAFGYNAVSGEHGSVLNLSPKGDLAEAAQNLFGYLRALDAENPTCIAVATIPDHGLGEAINDRILRAAAPRD